MSHFTVMVIGNNPEKQLAPYSEQDEKYMTFNDETEELKKKYETDTSSEFYCSSASSWGQQITKELFDKLKSSSIGKEFEYEVKKLGFASYFKNNEFYRGYYEVTGGKKCKGEQWFKVTKINQSNHLDRDICFEGIITIEKINPPKEIPVKDKYKSFDEYCKEYHGYEKKDGKYGYFRNKNAQWDWYQLGGRWVGFLKKKEEAVEALVGKPSLVSNRRAEEGCADQLRKCDIDFQFMEDEAIQKASIRYDFAMSVIGETKPNKPWKYYIEKSDKNSKKYSIEKVRKSYWNQQRCIKWKESKEVNDKLGFDSSPDDFLINREKYLENAKNSSFITFAVIKDGKWYQKGQMGWWGFSTDEVTQEDWNKQIKTMLNELPEDTLISIYDCHI